MSEYKPLALEVLSGPLDGAQITLDAEVEWTRRLGDLLSFPWDDELGEPQARLRPEGTGWTLEGMEATHGTYIVNRERKVHTAEALQPGDILKASHTWLRVSLADFA